MTQTPIRFLPGGDPVTGMAASDMVAAKDFTTDDHTETIHVFHADEKAGITAGVWTCAPCREEFDAYPVDEMMQILDGELVLTSPDGTSETYRAGDTFYMAKGTPIIWEIKKTLHKYFMITE